MHSVLYSHIENDQNSSFNKQIQQIYVSRLLFSFLFNYMNYDKIGSNSYSHLFSEGINHKGK